MPSDPSPPATPFRQDVDHLLEALTTSALASLATLERMAITTQLRRRGWELAHLSAAGPLSGLSDAALLRLLEMLSDRLDSILIDHGPEIVGERSPSEAIDELRAALTR